MSCNKPMKSAAFGNFACGDEIQGGVRFCEDCLRKHRANAEFLGQKKPELNKMQQAVVSELLDTGKRDFENLDTRLYLVLRQFLKDSKSGWDSGDWGRPCQETLDMHAAAESVMRDFEDSHGPFPEWAIARNFGFEYVLGTQLFTRDGRRHGNAWLVKISTQCRAALATRENPYGEWTAYTILTEAGSLIEDCNQQELEAAFWAGDWICTIDRIAERFDRDGLLRAMGAC